MSKYDNKLRRVLSKVNSDENETRGQEIVKSVRGSFQGRNHQTTRI